MKDEVGDERLLERRGESLDELVRKAADEPDGVGQEIAAPVVLERPRRRVEGLEEAVSYRHARIGQRIHERRLADVGVAGKSDRGRLRAAARLPACVALAAELDEPALEDRHPSPRESAVSLELGFPRASSSHSPAEPLEVLPHPTHSGEVVLELRELDLELPLGAHGVLGEDVEDELRAVDDAGLKCVLEQALLCRL